MRMRLATILHHLRLIPIGDPRSIVLLRGQSSSACFPPANRPVERPKLVLAVCPAVALAMRPAVPDPNQIYKRKFMKNADAKLHAPQYAANCSLKL